jgi:hypothetical protein
MTRGTRNRPHRRSVWRVRKRLLNRQTRAWLVVALHPLRGIHMRGGRDTARVDRLTCSA